MMLCDHVHALCEHLVLLNRLIFGCHVIMTTPTYLVMNADAESSVDVKHIKQPSRVDQQQMKVVHRRRLDNPVYPAGLELEQRREGEERRVRM